MIKKIRLESLPHPVGEDSEWLHNLLLTVRLMRLQKEKLFLSTIIILQSVMIIPKSSLKDRGNIRQLNENNVIVDYLARSWINYKLRSYLGKNSFPKAWFRTAKLCIQLHLIRHKLRKRVNRIRKSNINSTYQCFSHHRVRMIRTRKQKFFLLAKLWLNLIDLNSSHALEQPPVVRNWKWL